MIQRIFKVDYKLEVIFQKVSFLQLVMEDLLNETLVRFKDIVSLMVYKVQR